MMLVAVYMRPWLSIMEACYVEGKVMADDIMILAAGKTMLRKFGEASALHLTHRDQQSL